MITFLAGPAGSGKTTRAVAQLEQWLTGHVPPSRILIIVPQLTLAQPYRQLLRTADLPAAGDVDILTLSGLARRTIDLFWPLGAVSSGFGRPQVRPIFLNIEQAQYYLHQAIAPLLKEGFFDPNVVPVTISSSRLMSQLLDNLNKAALINLPHIDVARRLSDSLTPDPAGRVALQHTQACIDHFRQFCLDRNLLDYSLQIETFARQLWPTDGVRRYLTEHYRYLIVDNIEEDTPFAHTVLHDWLPHADEALLIHDDDAGYRVFLGANPQTAVSQLQPLTDNAVSLSDSFVAPPDVLTFGNTLSRIILGQSTHNQTGQATASPPDPRRAFTFEQTRFYPQMLDWVVDKIAELQQDGVPPEEIVVLAPFVSDALRFAFTDRMTARGLPVQSHRPSRPLSEEPPAKTMLTLARLAFPHWQLLPDPFDVTQALHQAIANLDLIRASLLTRIVYRQSTRPDGPLTAFEQIEGDMRDRISYQAGGQFDALRAWLLSVQTEAAPPPLDHFFSRLFGELLSQPGFGFHSREETGHIVAQLIDSARRFRQVAEQVPLDVIDGAPQFADADAINRAYLETIEQGIAAAQYVRRWESRGDAAVLITPATTFLMSNRPATYQFWLDAGSSGWWERIAQPLTHPYVLSASWEPGRVWTDTDEVAAQRDRLSRLVLGLTRRCRRHIFVVNAEISEQGMEQRGQLLLALHRLLRRLRTEPEAVV
jgi:hypothetical protein